LLGREHWFFTPEEVENFRQGQSQKLGREVQIGDESPLHASGAPNAPNGTVNGSAETMFVQEMHEVRRLNKGLEELRRQGLTASDLLPAPQIAGREPAPRFTLENDERKVNLAHLRDLVHEVRRLGERGMAVTRFKGLGEMDPEELWDTTLDPDKRTLMQVQLEDAAKAEELFRTLMGEKVEPRRDFIVEHAMRAKDIDYHGA
jgi:DNA gyrase subunit B